VRSLPPSVRENPHVSETPFRTITSINHMGAIAESFHQWLICTFSNHRNEPHARRAGSLTCRRQSQLKSRNGKCPGVRLNVIKTPMWRYMTPHFRRLPKLGNMFLDLRRLCGAFGGGGSLLGLAFVAFQVATSQIGARDHRDLSRRLDLHYPKAGSCPWRMAWGVVEHIFPRVSYSIPGCSFHKTFLVSFTWQNMQHGFMIRSEREAVETEAGTTY
jgi:hypothetical protein